MRNPLIGPVLKWVGGKRQLLPELLKRLPQKMNTYYEPFLGGGALFFGIQPSKAVLNDSNAELMNVYACIRDCVENLISVLETHKNEESYFYELRQLDRLPTYQSLPAVQRAARILYLNRTCYNGLFRVNQQGEFNSPFGFYKNPNIVNAPVLRAVSDFLKRAASSLLTGDYEDALKGIRRGAFVYFDPPYAPVSNSASFTGYTQHGFTRDEQRRLHRICKDLHSKGIKFMLSNSSTPFIHGLYRGFTVDLVQARRNVNSMGDKRGEVDEVIVRNY